MLSARVYWENGTVTRVVLNPAIKALTGQSTDVTEVQTALMRAKERDPNIVGIVVNPKGQVSFYRDGKYKAVIWPRRLLSGTWEECFDEVN